MSASEKKPAMSRKPSMWRDYGLSITLAILFVVAWAAQAATQWIDLANEAEERGQALTWSDFWPHFLAATFENWQSEFLQLLTFVILTAVLIHKGSHESKDTDEEFQRILTRMDRRLERLERSARGDETSSGS